MSAQDDPMIELDDTAVVWSEPREALGDRPLVLLLHGRGADERDLMPLASHLVPGAVYVSPRAPMRFPGAGFTWFPPAAPGLPDAGSVAAATRSILSWLDGVAPRGPVAVVGFSQGGALASHLMRFAPERFVGFAVLSGFVVPAEGPEDARLLELRPPVFWGRDVGDPVIPPAAIAVTEEWLPAHSTLQTRLYPGIGHSISMEEVGDLRVFLQECFASSDLAPSS